MAVRPSLAALIAQVRSLCGNVSPVVFTDLQIQNLLDRHRDERRWTPLRPVASFQPGGTILYLDYYGDTGAWEDDVLLQDMSYATLTPAASELIVGHWQFSQQPNGIGVRATGKTYDLYAAAADLLEAWAIQVSLDFDFQSDRDQYKRSQKATMLSQRAKEYRALATPRVSRLVQSDAAADHDGSGVVYPVLHGEGSVYGP